MKLTEYPNGAFIITAAFRYALGRQTYAPSIIVDMLKREWSDLSVSIKTQIRAEINEAIDQGLVHEIDKPMWEKVLKF